MNTDHHVQHNQMQAYLVFELARVVREVLSYEQEMNLEVLKQSGFLERGQINDQFQDGTTAFTLRVSRPKLREDRGSDDPNDSANVPVVLVEESADSTRTFGGRVFGSGIAIRQRIEGLELMAGDDEGLDGVEYGSGFFVQRTIRLLVGT